MTGRVDFDRIWFHHLFYLLCALVSVVTSVLEAPGVLVIFYTTLLAVILLTTPNLFAIIPPALCFSAALCCYYNSYDLFFPYLPWAVFTVAALIANLVIYRRPLRLRGCTSLPGLLAVSLALALGGIGCISASDYFAPASLYHILGLGFGLTLLYLLFRSRIPEGDEQLCRTRFLEALYLMGLVTAVLSVTEYTAAAIRGDEFRFFIPWQLPCRNNFSTMLMMALPAPLYYAGKRPLHLLAVLFLYAPLVFLGSRGGLLCGTAALLCLLFAYSIKGIRRRRRMYLCCFLAMFCGLLIASGKLMDLYSIRIGEGSWISDDEARAVMLRNGIRFFLENPIFGTGLGYPGNTGAYNPVPGAFYWYHMYVPQVFATMGCVGIAAYLFQLFTRLRLSLRDLGPQGLTFSLSYLGLLLMSQVNPGEFCPLPFGLLAMLIYLVLEFPGTQEETAKEPYYVKLSQAVSDR